MAADFIQQTRNVALSLLKPSAKELEHGLELHRECLVAESYGLFLQAPVDSDRLNELTNEGASDLEFQDTAEEMRVLGWLKTEELRRLYREAWEASGVDCTFVNAGEEGNDPMVLIKRLARYVRHCDEMPEFQGKALTVAGIKALRAEGKRALCLCPNGIPLTGNLSTAEDELRYLRVFAQLGARMMHLTYNRRNLIGDGCAEPANGGLSDFGRDVIQEMNRLGIIIDLAHTGWQTCLDAARASSRPVIVSHSAVWDLGRHVRCKPDEVIKAIVDSGGTIGITNVPRFLGGTGDICALLDHIDNVTKKFGVESVTIGTDAGFRYPSAADAALLPRAGQRSRWENHWPEGQHPSAPEWRKPEQVESLVWTNWPLFTVGLVQRGYRDDEIAKIIGGNLLRVAGQVWNPPA